MIWVVLQAAAVVAQVGATIYLGSSVRYWRLRCMEAREVAEKAFVTMQIIASNDTARILFRDTFAREFGTPKPKEKLS